jgi:hypothetical protein
MLYWAALLLVIASVTAIVAERDADRRVNEIATISRYLN